MSIQYKNYSVKIDGASLLQDALSPFANFESVAAYEAAVKDTLDTITKRANGVGQTILDALPKNKTLVIVPYETSAIHGVCNATASDATILESGNARVRFTPAIWIPGGVCKTAVGNGLGADSDEVLLHEILHAYRKLRGTYNKMPLSQPDKSYDNIEEFFAIVISNIYMSENGKTKFRKDHAGFDELPAKWATSETFIRDKDNFLWLEYFWGTERPLTSMLAFSSARFNPFKAYKNWLESKGRMMNIPITNFNRGGQIPLKPYE